MTQVRAEGGAALRKQWELHSASIYIRLLRTFGPLQIWEVNGRTIRDWVFIDFTEGGNSNAYAWLPPYHIILDTDVHPDEFWAVGLHEFHEYNKMATGLSYDPAHDLANSVELRARRQPEAWGELFDNEVRIFMQRLESGKRVDLNAQGGPG